MERETERSQITCQDFFECPIKDKNLGVCYLAANVINQSKDGCPEEGWTNADWHKLIKRFNKQKKYCIKPDLLEKAFKENKPKLKISKSNTKL